MVEVHFCQSDLGLSLVDRRLSHCQLVFGHVKILIGNQTALVEPASPLDLFALEDQIRPG